MGPTARTLVAASLLAAACSHAMPTPRLGLGPIRPGDPTVFEDALEAAREAGHPAIETDREHGRFVVRALSDASRNTVFVVQCALDGYLSVTAERRGTEGALDVLPPATRNEYASFVLALERSIQEAR